MGRCASCEGTEVETGAEGLEARVRVQPEQSERIMLGKHWGSRGLGKDCGRESACSHGRSPVFQIAFVTSTNFTSSLLDPRKSGIPATVVTPSLTGETIQEFYISGSHQDQAARSWARASACAGGLPRLALLLQSCWEPARAALGGLLGVAWPCSYSRV